MCHVTISKILELEGLHDCLCSASHQILTFVFRNQPSKLVFTLTLLDILASLLDPECLGGTPVTPESHMHNRLDPWHLTSSSLLA